jgi:hypothetical protein
MSTAPGEPRKKSMNKRYCLTLDLKDDPALIAEYRRYHQKIWPEITNSIKDPASLIWKFICSTRACS